MSPKYFFPLEELEERLTCAFKVLKNKKYPFGKWERALALVPGMSKTVLRERFLAGDTSLRSRGRPSHLGPAAEEAVFKFAEGQANVGKPLGKNGIVKKLIGMSKALGHKSSEPSRARYFKGFLKRMELKVVIGQKTDAARFFAVTTETVGRFADIAEVALEGVKPCNVWVGDECGFAAEDHDRRVRCARTRPPPPSGPLSPLPFTRSSCPWRTRRCRSVSGPSASTFRCSLSSRRRAQRRIRQSWSSVPSSRRPG